MLDALEREADFTRTENGALAHVSTGDPCLDFFASCGALRDAPVARSVTLFGRAYAADADLAMRALFYARDVRGGLGERKVFRQLLGALARVRPHSVERNVAFIPELGRWDDLLVLLDTPCEDAAVRLIREQLERDRTAMAQGQGVSLLAKWLPSVNTASAAQRQAARRLCGRLGLSQKRYRQTLSALRQHSDVLERRLCARDYRFDYAGVPSRAAHKYRAAFQRHDGERYRQFLERVRRGEAKLHADTIYPYDIVHACIDPDSCRPARLRPEQIAALDGQWRSLPDFCDGRNALAVVDGSGSMYWDGCPLPAEVAMSLGIYFAEHNTGAFRDHFITFSRQPRLVRLQGGNIADRVAHCMSYNACENTDLMAVFNLVLSAAVRGHLPQEELPEALYIITDMEFDEAMDADTTVFDAARALYARFGYSLPTVVFWCVQQRSAQFPVRQHDTGAVLVSGASPTVFQMAIRQEVSPGEYMRSVLSGPRYRDICA